jgi:nicotinate (nicotinamide) nucleotide adenylyltransferase
MNKKRKKIVVMGGSFNPPTSAHLRLMKEAVDVLNANIGFFVPVSDAYLKRKMRHSHPPVVLSPEMRVRMLQSMCADDSRLQVCEKEIGTIEPRTMPTLQALQEDYPEAELYFVMGADKFALLASLTKKRQFLDAFKVVLYSREGAALEQSIKDDEVLSNYLDRMVILPRPEGTEGVSSSLVRERMLRGESSSDLLCPGVWELFKEYTAADFPDTITRFKGEYDYLSNRYPCRIVWEGLEYRSAEAAFQASKCKDEKERKVFAECSTDKAVLKGKDLTPYPGWEEAQISIMESILQAKFGQNPTLMLKLAETGNHVLLNGNNKQETFWGIDLYSWIGENHLGRIIMNIRDKEIKR